MEPFRVNSLVSVSVWTAQTGISNTDQPEVVNLVQIEAMRKEGVEKYFNCIYFFDVRNKHVSQMYVADNCGVIRGQLTLVSFLFHYMTS